MLLRLIAIMVPALLLATPALADRQEAEPALRAGMSALKQGNPQAALPYLAAAIKADPDWADAHAARGEAYIRVNKSKPALTELERALQLGIKPELVNHLIAQVWLLSGDPQRALTEAGASRVAPAYAADGGRVRARAMTMLGDFAGAGRELDAAAAISPDNAEVWADIARFRLDAGNIAGAQQAGARAAALHPQNPTTLLLMAGLVRDQYGPRAALAWAELAVQVDPGSLEGLRLLAGIQGDTGQSLAMLATARKMLALDPLSADAFYVLAVLAARAGDTDLAQRLYFRTSGRLDSLPAVRQFAGALSLQSGNYQQAATYLSALVEQQPGNAEARRLLAMAYLKIGDPQSVVETLLPLARASGADSYSLALIGRAYEALDDRTSAAVYLDRAASPVRGDPAPFGMSFDLAIRTRGAAVSDAYVAVPRISQMIANGQADQALPQALSLRDANTGVPAAHVLLGDVLMAMGKTVDAIAAYQQASNISFSEPIMLRLVNAYLRAGQTADAENLLDIYLNQNPRSIPALLLASERFVARARWDPAEQILTRLRARLGDGNGTVLDNLGWVWFNKGNSKKALEAAGAAVALSPTNPAYTGNYGWLLFKTGKDKKGAARLLKKAVALSPQHAGFRYQLAQVLIDAGQGQAAKPHLAIAAASAAFVDQAKAAELLAAL